jgi:tripartite-type tricarboxylate transporter receptor subunit TctC
VVERLYGETRKVVEMPSVRDKLATLGGEPMPMTQREFDRFLRDEIAMNAALVKAAGIKGN